MLIDVNDASMAANMHLKIVEKSPQESLKKRPVFDEMAAQFDEMAAQEAPKLAEQPEAKKKMGGVTKFTRIFWAMLAPKLRPKNWQFRQKSVSKAVLNSVWIGEASKASKTDAFGSIFDRFGSDFRVSILKAAKCTKYCYLQY